MVSKANSTTFSNNWASKWNNGEVTDQFSDYLPLIPLLLTVDSNSLTNMSKKTFNNTEKYI